MGDTPLLSVVVPTRNEADNVAPLVERLRRALEGVDLQLCFVDDSDDGTAAVLERLVAGDPAHMRCLFRQGSQRQGGLSTAVVAGLRLAEGTYVCVMDADLQHPPEAIPAMLEAARAGSDLVVASRYTAGGSRAGLGGAGRRVVSRGATGLARLLFTEARRSRDPLSGFFLCRRAVLDGIEFRPVGFKILLELLVCVPTLQVRDVPLSFQPRESGSSKASLRQGLLYLRHVRSLFLQVQGSARPWKFALVGVSGLGVFLGALAALAGPGGLAAVAAFFPAFAISLAWNTALNRLWTYADQRRRSGGAGPRRYLENALLSGVVMLGLFALLTALHLPVLAAGTIAAAAGMALSGVTNRRWVRTQASPWAQIALDRGVQTSLAQLAHQVGADRAYLLPGRLRGVESAVVPAEVLRHVVAQRRPVLWTEAASHRPQRRTNIEVNSLLVVPAVSGDTVAALVVCERHAPRGFEAGALETAQRIVDELAGILAAAREPAAMGDPGGSTAATTT